MKKISIILGLLLISGLVMAADFQPWVGVRGSYQAVFHTDLFDSAAAFEVDRARVGVEGEWLKDIYFQVEVDARNTKKGKGAELKVAFVRWSFLDMDDFKGAVEFGALTTTFARGLSGTEYAFINYDITTVPASYQYGIQAKGNIMDKFVEVIASVSDGEGLSSINIAKGLLYMGRVEVTPLGNDIKDLREGNTGRTLASGAPMLTISFAAALDNKAKTDDLGYTSETYNSTHLLADLTFKMMGFSLFGQFVINNYDALSDGTYWGGVNKNVKKSSGGFVQLGYNLKDLIGFELEPMVKFEDWNDVLNEGYGDVDTRKRDIAIALNWYASGHDFKLNFEYRRMLKDKNFYFGKPPAKDYFGLRVTHKFGAKLALGSKPQSRPAATEAPAAN